MPLPEVLEQRYRTMRALLERDVGVQFVTKDAIPEDFFSLFAQRPELVAAQIGLTSLNDQLNAAATAAVSCSPPTRAATATPG